MKAKKFTAPTMREALGQVKKELGDGAIILKSKKVPRGGVFDIPRREMVEVTAASEEPAFSESTTGPDFAQQLDGSFTPRQSAGVQGTAHHELEMIKDEVRSLRENLAEVSLHLKYSKMPALSTELSTAYTRLEESGLEEHWVQDLINQALVELTGNELVSSPDIDRYLVAQVSGVFARPARIRPSARGPLSMAFIGPAGSGKTTTLSKLATHRQLFGKHRVGIITVDTRRLAAVEQIRAFAQIAGIPLEVVYKPEQMKAARARLGHVEVLLVDTPGCNPRDEQALEQLHKLIDRADCDEVHLVLSATTRDREMYLICDKYRIVPYSHLLFTHVDETGQYGAIANVAHHVAKPVVYIGSGPSIPKDIQKLEPHRIAEWILHPDKEYSFAESRPL
jgi:flagellar biosynthesis protein FlhF